MQSKTWQYCLGICAILLLCAVRLTVALAPSQPVLNIAPIQSFVQRVQNDPLSLAGPALEWRERVPSSFDLASLISLSKSLSGPQHFPDTSARGVQPARLDDLPNYLQRLFDWPF